MNRVVSKVCPRCGRVYVTKPAISRRDNTTEICPQCGTEEGLIDAGLMPTGITERNFLKKLKKKK